MEIVRITDEQKNKLTDELAKLIYEFKKIENVDCAYFESYICSGTYNGPGLTLTLVTSQTKDDDFNYKLGALITRYNILYSSEHVEKYGVKIYVDTDSADEYTVVDLNPSEIERANFLFNSTILFDKSGKYTKIKEYAQENYDGKSELIFYYNNLAEIHPPITEEIQDKCKKLG